LGFETGSDNKKIDELENRIDDIIDSQLTSVGGNESLSIDSTLGQRNAASGDAGGVRSNQPIIHNITENDEGGTPTGVFDKINLISSMIIVDHTSTPIDLRFIQGSAKDGAKIKITVKKDKTLVIKSGGNILTSSDITISDTEFFILVKYSQAETGVTGGAYKILLTGTGGGGISFPIDFPEDDRGTVGASTQDILFTDSDRHSVKMEITGDIALAFSSPPTNETAYTNIIIVQDGVGGHTLTLPIGTVNKDTVEAGFLTGIDEETGIVIKFAFGVFYAFLETGNIVTGGSGITNLSDLVIDVNKDWLAQGISNVGSLTGVTGISATGSGVIISGIDTYDFFQAGQSIQNKADPDGGLLYDVNNVQSHIFRANTIEIARFAEVAAGVYRLEMFDHSIRDAQDITFDNASGATVFAGTSPAFGFDSVAASLVINFPAGAKITISENNVIGSTIIRDNEVESDLLTVNSSLLIGLLGGTPTNPGQFTNDGIDTFVFSGGAIRNFSNIGVAAGGADVFLSNLSGPTAINQDLNFPVLGSIIGVSIFSWITSDNT